MSLAGCATGATVAPRDVRMVGSDRVRSWGWWGAGLLLIAGCGGTDRLWPVAGTVSFSDGRPLEGGVIELKPMAAEGRPARAAIGAGGRFALETAGRPGARAGRYHVAIVPHLVVGHSPHGAGLPPRFSRFDQSGLEVEVPRGGAGELDVTVDVAP